MLDFTRIYITIGDMVLASFHGGRQGTATKLLARAFLGSRQNFPRKEHHEWLSLQCHARAYDYLWPWISLSAHYFGSKFLIPAVIPGPRQPCWERLDRGLLQCRFAPQAHHWPFSYRPQYGCRRLFNRGEPEASFNIFSFTPHTQPLLCLLLGMMMRMSFLMRQA